VPAFIRTRPDLLETTEESLRRGQMIACTPRSWSRVSQIMQAVPDRSTRAVMIAGTVGDAAAAEFALIADEIAATVQVAEMLETPSAKRADLYPKTLHGLTALIYGLVAQVDRATLPDGIDILADLRGLDASAFRGLPLNELASFGFELLITRALAEGWEDAFATSQSYAAYAADRQAAGLP
jgi:hypothetical protein